MTLPFSYIAVIEERRPYMLATDNTVLLIVDVQGKLAHLMHEKEILFNNIRNTIKGAQVLDIPILVTEQYPEGLGPTIPEVTGMFENPETISKTSFSCCGEDRFMQILNDLHPENILVAGIETHVCVYQTVRDLLRANYAVQIIVDAVSSRTKNNKKIGLKKIIKAGAEITSVETVLFELLREAGGGKFKNILEIVK